MRSPASGQNATVLITGGTDGLGRAAALLLAEQGFRVFAAGRSTEKRAALDAVARERRLPLEMLEMDVASDASVDRALEEIGRKAGAVDALINNAGIAYAAAVEEISLDDLRRQFETNFFGVVRVTQRLLPAMRQRRRGRIINMSSISGKFSGPVLGAYSASKFALEAISDALRLELYPFGVHVVLIEPGFIPTNMEKASMELSSAYAGRMDRSPYAAVYRGFRDAWRKTTRASAAPMTSEDCAKVILRALRETPPKPRYMVVRSAWKLNLVRRLFSDRAMDRWAIRAMGLDKAREASEQESKV